MPWQVYNSAGQLLQATDLPDNAVTNAKVANNAIDSAELVAGSVDNAHLADDAVGIAELSATGTASSSTFLRGDNAWAAPGGGPSQAVEADIEGMTNQDTYIPPDLLRHGPGVAKAWCRLTMSGQAFKVEYGMASISDAGVGVSDIVVDDAFTVGNTSFVVMSGGAIHVTTDQAATTSTTVRVNNRDSSHNSEDGGDIYVVYWGLI